MKRVAFNPNAIEYAECIAPDMYEGLSLINVFNAAVAVTHTQMRRGKKLVPTERDNIGFTISSTPDNIKYWRNNKPPRKNADLTNINYDRLEAIKNYYSMNTIATALGFCLRTLRSYTDEQGVAIIINTVCSDGNSKAHEVGEVGEDLVRERFYIRISHNNWLKEEAIKAGVSKSQVISNMIRDKMNAE